MLDFRKTILFIPALLYSIFATSQTITTIAGNGVGAMGGDGGAATAARLNNPTGVVIDAAGNIYIADFYNYAVRKVDPLGGINSIAGNGTFDNSGDGGPSVGAGMGYPAALALDASGNLYVADFGNHNVRKITPSGTISLFAGGGSSLSLGDGGPATAAYLDEPTGVAVDTAGNVYIADHGGNRIRKVNKTGTISTFAGTGVPGFSGDGGPATAATFRAPYGVATDKKGNLFIADSYNSCIRKISVSDTISTIAGLARLGGYSGDGGAATAAQLSAPYGIVVDTDGVVYVTDTASRIRRISIFNKINTIAGTGASGYNGDYIDATAAKLDYPAGVALDAAGNIYFADAANERIRMIVKNTTGVPAFISTVVTSLSIYPNPATTFTTIKLSSPIHEEAQITITNMLGTQVQNITVTTNKETGLPLHLPSGIYMVTAAIKEERISTLITVE